MYRNVLPYLAIPSHKTETSAHGIVLTGIALNVLFLH